MMVAAVQPAERPAWARLPESQGHGSSPHRRRAAGAAAGRGPARRAATHGCWAIPARTAGRRRPLVVLGLVAAIGGWWFGVGRYTSPRSW